MLPELVGWKERQLKAVDDNPFVKIVDSATYEEAKRARTALVKARTTVEKQERLIASKLRELRVRVGEASKELVSITLHHEQRQQHEVKQYEAERERVRAEKQERERKRKEELRNTVLEIQARVMGTIDGMTYETIEKVTHDIETFYKEADPERFGEFELLYEEHRKQLTKALKEKAAQLREQERMREEREELERMRREVEREKMELQRQREEALAKQREEERAEESRQRALKEEKERAKREAERERREKELLPDREKLQHFLDSLDFSDPVPELGDTSSKNLLEGMLRGLASLKGELQTELSNLI